MSNVDIGSSGSASGGIAIGDAISGGTAGRILYEGAGPVLADSANLTYDGTTLSVTSPSSGSVPMKIVGASGQSADLLQLINNGGGTMVSFEDDGNLLISVTGSSTASPRLFGMSALNPGTAARWQFGDNLNCIQCGNGKQIQMVAYHGLQLVGAHYQFSSWPFATDTGSCVHIPSTQAAYITLLIDGKTSQTADLTRWRNAAGTTLYSVTPSGYMQASPANINADQFVYADACFGNGTMGASFLAAGGVFASVMNLLPGDDPVNVSLPAALTVSSAAYGSNFTVPSILVQSPVAGNAIELWDDGHVVLTGSLNCLSFQTQSLVEVGTNTGGSNISWLTINGDAVDPYLRCNNGGGTTVATINFDGAFQVFDSANAQMLEMAPGDATILFQIEGGAACSIYANETITNTVNFSTSAVAPVATASLGRTSNAVQWHDGTAARYLFNKIRKNSAGTVFSRAQVNLIEGSNITLTVADDAANGEIDVTIAASGLSRGQVVALMTGNYLV